MLDRDAALLGDARSVGGEAVAQVDHRADAGTGQGGARFEQRPRPPLPLDQLLADLDRKAMLLALEQHEARAGSTEPAGHSHELTGGAPSRLTRSASFAA